VVVVVVFGVSWLPLHLQSLAAYFGLESPRGAVYEVFRVLWNCMAYSNSCANPFIYHCRPTSDGPRRGRLATVPTAVHQRRSRPQPTSDGPHRCPPATVPTMAHQRRSSPWSTSDGPHRGPPATVPAAADQRRSPPWPEASPSAAGTPQRHDRRSVSLLPVTLVLVMVLRTRSWLLYVLVVVLFEVSRAVIVLHLYYVVYTDVGIEAHRNDTMVLVLVLEKKSLKMSSHVMLVYSHFASMRL